MAKTNCTDFAEAIRIQLIKKEMTYKDLARITGYSASYIGTAMSIRHFSPRMARKIAKALGLTITGIAVGGVENAEDQTAAT